MDQKLYRYLPFNRFNEMLCTKKLAVMNPSKWPDQYELYWDRWLSSKQGIEILENQIEIRAAKNKSIDVEHAIDSLQKLCKISYGVMYAACFTNIGDTEFMWKANSDNNCSIMFETTRSRIFDLFKEDTGFSPYIQNVEYDLEEKYGIDSFLQNLNVYPGVTGYNDHHEWFLHKRKCFEYENEVRLLVDVPDFMMVSEKEREKVIKIDIPELSKFITGVKVNPAASDDHVALVRILCDYYGIEFKGQSDIYKCKFD